MTRVARSRLRSMGESRHRRPPNFVSPPNEDGWTVRKDLPFNVPPREMFEQSPYKIIPHQFAVKDHRLRAMTGNPTYGNRVGDAGCPDLFDNNFLPDPPPGSTTGAVPASSSQFSTYMNVGKYWRNHPKRQPPMTSSIIPMGRLDRGREAKEAWDWFMTGFFIETVSSDPADPLECLNGAMDQLEGKNFWMLPMLDFSTPSGLYNQTATGTANFLKALYDHPRTTKINGRAQIGVFYAENKPLSFYRKQTPTAADGLHDIMDAAGKPCDFSFCYVASPVYGPTGYAEMYKSVAVRHGRWGDRDPTLISRTVIPGTPPKPDSQNAAQAYVNDLQAGLTPGKALGNVAPGDERPKSGTGKANENRCLESLMAGWRRQLWGNGLGNSVKFDGSNPVGNTNPARCDWVQLVTWSDISEGSEFWSNRNTGYNLLAMSLFYMIPLMCTDNVFPTIQRDCLWMHHRVQFTSGMTYTSTALNPTTKASGFVRQGSTPWADIVQIIVWATEPCTVEIVGAGGGTTAAPLVKNVSQDMLDAAEGSGLGGMVVIEVGLEKAAPGTLKATMKRDGLVVKADGPRGLQDVTITSPWAITHKRYSPDYAQRGGTSLGDWPLRDYEAAPNAQGVYPSAGFDIPPQQFYEIT